jgi:hypothetical protein
LFWIFSYSADTTKTSQQASITMDRPFPLREQRMYLPRRRPDLGHPWRNLCFAVIPVILASAAFAWAAQSKPKPQPPAEPVAAALPRSDKLYVERAVPSVVEVRTIPIVPQPAPAPVVEKVAAVAEPEPSSHVNRRERTRGDICTRHGLRKVTTRGGRSWRCR